MKTKPKAMVWIEYWSAAGFFALMRILPRCAGIKIATWVTMLLFLFARNK